MGNCDEGCNGEVSVNLFFEHDDEKYYIDDIVWWKEIVLTKESENENTQTMYLIKFWNTLLNFMTNGADDELLRNRIK